MDVERLALLLKVDRVVVLGGGDDKNGGMSGATFSRISTGNNVYVVKAIAIEKIELSKTLGLPREALFYQYLGKKLKGIVPSCRYASGDMSSGQKLVVMEDLKG